MTKPKESVDYPDDRPPFPRLDRFPFRHRPRLYLLDDKKQLVAGRPGSIENDKFIKITVDEKTVGWLAYKKKRPFKAPLEAAFLRQQYELFYMIGAGILLITGIVAFLLSKHLLAPVRKLADGTQALTNRGGRRFGMRRGRRRPRRLFCRRGVTA